jgi:hypothetical protein
MMGSVEEFKKAIKSVEDRENSMWWSKIDEEYTKRVYEMMESGKREPPSKIMRESILAVMERKRKEEKRHYERNE